MSSIIQVKGLKKNFGALQVLKGVDAAIEENEVVCIIGYLPVPGKAPFAVPESSGGNYRRRNPD